MLHGTGSFDLEKADQWIDEATELTEQTGDPVIVAGARFAIGEYQLMRQRPGLAEQ